MGDLVLTEDEVNPVMSALLENGLDVTALHNHFFWEQPRIFYMHVHGMGTAADLAPTRQAGARADRRGGRRRPRRRAAGRPRRCAGHRGARRDHRAPGRADRAGLQDHHRPARHRPARARRRDQRADGPQHLGRLRRHRRRRDGGRRCRDARDARSRRCSRRCARTASNVVAIHHHMTGVEAGRHLPALLRHGTGEAAGRGRALCARHPRTQRRRESVRRVARGAGFDEPQRRPVRRGRRDELAAAVREAGVEVRLNRNRPGLDEP